MSSAQFAVTRFYFSLFMGGAVIVTYLPIWLHQRGVTDTQIGYMNALPMLIILLISVSVGRIADRASDWKKTILVGQCVSFGFTLILGFATDFWLLLVLWACTVVPGGVVMPVADAATIRLGLRKGFSFGTVRAWGTVGYLLISVVAGWVIYLAGSWIFLWLLAGFAGLRAWMAYLLPPMRDPGHVRPQGSGALISSELRAGLRLWIVLPMLAAALLFSTHLIMNGFSALIWSEQGISEATIGYLVALGAGAEASTMFVWKWIQARFTARQLILIAAVSAIIRWVGMAMAPGLWLLVPLQMMQAVTFSLGYLGCMYFIANRTQESVAAEAQGLLAMMQQAACVVMLSLFGVLYQTMGTWAFMASAVLAGLSGLLVVASFYLQRVAEADAPDR